MFIVTAATGWVMALAGLVLTVAQLAAAGAEPAAWMLAVAGAAALAAAARLWAARWSERRQLHARLHDLAMVRLLRPHMG